MDKKRILLRLPAEIADKLAQRAKASGKSLNQYMVDILSGDIIPQSQSDIMPKKVISSTPKKAKAKAEPVYTGHAPNCPCLLCKS